MQQIFSCCEAFWVGSKWKGKEKKLSEKGAREKISTAWGIKRTSQWGFRQKSSYCVGLDIYCATIFEDSLLHWGMNKVVEFIRVSKFILPFVTDNKFLSSPLLSSVHEFVPVSCVLGLFRHDSLLCAFVCRQLICVTSRFIGIHQLCFSNDWHGGPSQQLYDDLFHGP